MDQVYFIYVKDKIHKVIDLESSKENHQKLINEGWIHIMTIDAIRFIENILNEKYN